MVIFHFFRSLKVFLCSKPTFFSIFDKSFIFTKFYIFFIFADQILLNLIFQRCLFHNKYEFILLALKYKQNFAIKQATFVMNNNNDRFVSFSMSNCWIVWTVLKWECDVRSISFEIRFVIGWYPLSWIQMRFENLFVCGETRSMK